MSFGNFPARTTYFLCISCDIAGKVPKSCGASTSNPSHRLAHLALAINIRVASIITGVLRPNPIKMIKPRGTA